MWKVMSNHEILIPRGMTSLRQAMGNIYKKNIHYIWFSHFTLTESHRCWKFSLSLYFIKDSFSISLCWPTAWQLKLSLNCWVAVERSMSMYWQFFYYRPSLSNWSVGRLFLIFKRSTVERIEIKKMSTDGPATVTITADQVNFYSGRDR